MAEIPTNEDDVIEDRKLFFTDGCVTPDGAVVIPAQFDSRPDVDVTRVVMRFDDLWLHHDMLEDMVRSVTFSKPSGVCYLMGRNGIIRRFGGRDPKLLPDRISGTFETETIGDVEKFGELFRIRSIAGVPYICGSSRQVYMRANSQWMHRDDGILELAAPALEDIDGTSADDIYAVGLLGTILHFNGKKWSELDSPTNQHLSNVRCVTPRQVYVCGNHGSLFVGNRSGWRFIGDSDIDANFWGMTRFRDQIYVCDSRDVLRASPDGLERLNIAGDRAITCHRLDANEQEMWSFGPHHLFRFDGSTWAEVLCPENA